MTTRASTNVSAEPTAVQVVAGTKGARRRLGILVVAQHHVAAAQLDLAPLAFRQLRAAWHNDARLQSQRQTR